MNAVRHWLAVGLLALAMPVHAAWNDNNIQDTIDKVGTIFTQVGTIFTDVTGDIKEAAQNLVGQAKKRTQFMRENIEDLVSLVQNRETPLRDFVSGGQGRCGTGSPCASFRTDLKTFALQMRELKDRFPVLEQHGLGDTRLFADFVDILPPVALFAAHEVLKLIPDWQDLPVDLADIFDEIGDSDAFGTTVEPSPQLAAQGSADGMKAALAEVRPTAVGKPAYPMEVFCSKGKEARIDDVRFNRLKGLVTRWKNRFDSFSTWQFDDIEISLAGEGALKLKIPAEPFFKTVSNALDSVHDLMEGYRDNLELCAKVEADLASCVKLVEYRTFNGARKAYFVMTGILSRSSLADLDKTASRNNVTTARTYINSGRYVDGYATLCAAYSKLWPAT